MSTSWQSEKRREARRKMHDYGRMLKVMGANYIDSSMHFQLVFIGSALMENWLHFSTWAGVAMRTEAMPIINKHLGEDHEQD